jgi:hypothetical protein
MDIKEKLDVFIRQNSVDMHSLLRNAKILQFVGAGEMRSVSMAKQSICLNDDSVIVHVGDRLSALICDYSSLHAYINHLIGRRQFDSSTVARSIAEMRTSRGRTNQMSAFRMTATKELTTGNLLAADSGFTDVHQQRRVKVRVPQNRRQHNNSIESVSSCALHSTTNTRKVVMKYDVTVGVKGQQIYASEASVSTAIHFRVV